MLQTVNDLNNKLHILSFILNTTNIFLRGLILKCFKQIKTIQIICTLKNTYS